MKSLLFAIFCVFMENNQAFSTQITLSSKFGDWVQQIEYEGSPGIFHSCGKVGHASTNCLRNKKQHFLGRKRKKC